jgi:hypothetical protein
MKIYHELCVVLQDWGKGEEEFILSREVNWTSKGKKIPQQKINSFN